MTKLGLRELQGLMELDDEVCLCFHVSKRKIVNWIRVQKPTHVTQIAECGGAGTGCGWCRVMLQQIFTDNSAQLTGNPAEDSGLGATFYTNHDEYIQARKSYLAHKKATENRESNADDGS